MKNDPIVAEVRAIRKTIERSCGNDPKRFAERLRLLEGEYRARLVSTPAGKTSKRLTQRVADAKTRYGKK